MTTPVRTTWVETIEQDIEQKRESYLETSHRIHATPEIGIEEFFASRLHAERLTAEGFTVELGVAGHETAFFAKKSSDRPGATIAFLAEYDALPGIGHACGHNIIGTTSVAAAIALSKVLDEVGGSVVVLGTPAEEGGPNGSAKGSFVKHQLLEGIDAALMVHPSGPTRITGSSLAVDPLDFAFTGRPAHAAATPEEGINALDAVIQLFNGINALRQQLPDDVRIHGIITHGGDAPNIIPEYAKARFFIRATTRERLNAVTEKVKAVAQGAALATGATLDVIAFQNEVDNLVFNRTFDRLFQEEAEALGQIVHLDERPGLGSTDAGNISQVIPTIHPYIKIGSDDLVAHTEAFKEAARSEAGDEALIAGAKILARTALRVLADERTRGAIAQEFHDRKNGYL
jgi:amidohydrolase